MAGLPCFQNQPAGKWDITPLLVIESPLMLFQSRFFATVANKSLQINEPIGLLKTPFIKPSTVESSKIPLSYFIILVG
jgi:hypothetical protein